MTLAQYEIFFHPYAVYAGTGPHSGVLPHTVIFAGVRWPMGAPQMVISDVCLNGVNWVSSGVRIVSNV